MIHNIDTSKFHPDEVRIEKKAHPNERNISALIENELISLRGFPSKEAKFAFFKGFCLRYRRNVAFYHDGAVWITVYQGRKPVILEKITLKRRIKQWFWEKFHAK